MSTSFDSMLASDAGTFMSASGEFAEPITYLPRAGTARSIYGIVVRNPPATPAELQRGVAPSLEITVRNDAALGITPAQLDIGGDAISVAIRLGEPASKILLPAPTFQDAGAMMFRIGKTK